MHGGLGGRKVLIIRLVCVHGWKGGLDGNLARSGHIAMVTTPVIKTVVVEICS